MRLTLLSSEGYRLKEKNKTPKKKRRGPRVSIIFKSISGLAVLMIVFSVIVSIIGFNGFTQALMEQYYDGAVHTADTAIMILDSDRIDDYYASGGKTREYTQVSDKLETLCNSSGSTFIYVIRPDKTYDNITFLFSTINENSSYTRYEFGYVRPTTNDEYKEKYRRLYEEGSDNELVIRDQGYIETDPHITAMIPIRDKSGKTTAILCVQRQMDSLVNVRNTYLGKVFFSMLGLLIFVVIGQSIYLNRVILRPVKQIANEAGRFASDNTAADKKLEEKIRTRDEISLLASSIDRMEERIIRYVEDLTKATAEKERISTELSLAARIQADMLPGVFPPFPDRSEFDIYAAMDPAKEVGGDFYDFFLVDDDHLCIVMADVSGKGVPAALFMMSSKIILANNAMSGKSPAQILTDTNAAVCANNREDMFVTVWLGILELSTGRLTAANAGHEYPVLMKPDGEFELYRDKHGFVLGGISGMSYKEYEIRLSPGSKLFLYTDGVPEATDKAQEQFGIDRMIGALNEHSSAAPGEILKNVRRSVNEFVKDAEQFDDLTMLCIEYRGAGKSADDKAADGDHDA